MKNLLVAILLLVSSIASADIIRGGGFDNRGRNDDSQRVRELEKQVADLNQRLVRCEDSNRPVFKDVTCMVSSDMNSFFIGKGHTEIDAKAAALQSCQNSINAMFCKNVRCDNPQETSRIRGATCMLTSDMNTVYKGEGSSLLEAEYNVRKTCSSSVNGMFCKRNVECQTY